MHEQLKTRLKEKLSIKNIGTFYFCDHIMISEINKGVEVTFDMVFKITETYTKKYFGTEIPFVFITNRINSYSLDPTIHLKTRTLLPNTIGFASVTYDTRNSGITNLEQHFITIPYKTFGNIDDAVRWADDIITHNSSSNNF